MQNRTCPLLALNTDQRMNSARSVGSSSTSDESLHQEPTDSTSSSDEAETAPPARRNWGATQTAQPRTPLRSLPLGSPKRLGLPPKPAGARPKSPSPPKKTRSPLGGHPPVAPHLRRMPADLLNRIMERGKRRNSSFPVIDGLYAEANEPPSARGLRSPLTPREPMGMVDSLNNDALMNLMMSRQETVDLCSFQTDDVSSVASPRPDESTANCITVAIRIRPLSKLELAEGQSFALAVDGQKVIAADPGKSPVSPTRYRFDEVLCSAPSFAAPLASQSDVFSLLGLPLLRNLIDGYNACLLCYGQTGSGKTYTMMGTLAEPGLVPRCADAVFQCLEERTAVDCQSASLVQVSFIEIYNEKVNDLLAQDQPNSPKGPSRGADQTARGRATPRAHAVAANASKGLRVRQHPLKGAFVEGLTQHTVASGAAILELVRRGNEARATAATRMNERSSRSHAIVTIEVAQQAIVSQSGEEEVLSSKTSCVHLVDLAGSERVTKSNVEGARLQELTAINLSLSTLSRVIETLSDTSRSSSKLPPYRESTLTWLLADSFGGNSKTTMIANVSPAASSLSETTSTLRYAARARRIVNQAVINEDPNAALISVLQAETQQLRLQLLELSEQAMNLSSMEEVEDLRIKLNFSEQLIEELKEQEVQERRNFELQVQRLSAHDEEQALTQQEMRRKLDNTESQLQWAQQEARRKDVEIKFLREKSARQLQMTQQECREAQQRELGAHQQLTRRMAAEWKVLQQVGLPCTLEGTDADASLVSGVDLTVDQLEAAEAQLLSAWQQMQADVAECQQRLVLKEAEAAQLVQACQEETAEAQHLNPDLVLLTLERGQLAAQVTDLELQLEEAAELCAVAEQERQEWEENAKQMARQMQECMVQEGRLLMALQCAGSGLARSFNNAGTDLDRAVEVVNALGAERISLQKRVEQAEDELVQCQCWFTGTGGVGHLPAAGLRMRVREVMAGLELRVGSSQGAEDVLAMSEHVIGRPMSPRLRVNEHFAEGRFVLEAEKKALQAELADVSGKLERAMTVVRRLHTEQNTSATTLESSLL